MGKIETLNKQIEILQARQVIDGIAVDEAIRLSAQIINILDLIEKAETPATNEAVTE